MAHEGSDCLLRGIMLLPSHGDLEYGFWNRSILGEKNPLFQTEFSTPVQN